MDLNGTYLGFTPTDESGVGLGEVEVVISDDSVSFRIATGLEVHSDEVPRELRPLTPDELAELFNPGADITGTTGYMLGDDGPIFLFLADLPEVPAEASKVLILRFVNDEIDGIFGPTRMFTPKQVEAGYFEAAVVEIETVQGDPGVIPRLARNGLRS